MYREDLHVANLGDSRAVLGVQGDDGRWSAQCYQWPQCPQPRRDATGSFRASCFWVEDSGETLQVIGPVDSFQGFWRHEVQVERWALESHLQGTSRAADREQKCKNAAAGLPHITLPHSRSRNYISQIATTGQILDSSYWWSLGTDAQADCGAGFGGTSVWYAVEEAIFWTVLQWDRCIDCCRRGRVELFLLWWMRTVLLIWSVTLWAVAPLKPSA